MAARACAFCWRSPARSGHGLPGLPVTVALVAGMPAGAPVGMGKPVAVLLIRLLLTGASAPGALCVGALVGYGAARLLPARAGH